MELHHVSELHQPEKLHVEFLQTPQLSAGLLTLSLSALLFRAAFRMIVHLAPRKPRGAHTTIEEIHECAGPQK
jgi:hypothetical protein